MAFSHVRTCAKCGKKNRVGARHLSANARCGACQTALGPVAEPLEVDAAAFSDVIEAAPTLVLVDFWAPWCGPCRTAAPDVAALARELAGQLVVLKVNTEAHPDLGRRYEVQAIPNFMIFKDGKLAGQHAGLMPRAEMRSWIERVR